MPPHPSFAPLSHSLSPPQQKKGGGAPTGAYLETAPAGAAPPPYVSRVTRNIRRGLASRRSTAALAAQMNATAQPRPCFLGRGPNGRYPPNPVPVQRCTSRTGHNAGRSDARTAREWGYEAHPQEPHPPHRSAVTGRRPFDGRDCGNIFLSVTSIKRVSLKKLRRLLRYRGPLRGHLRVTGRTAWRRLGQVPAARRQSARLNVAARL